MTEPTFTQGRFVWADLMARDANRARAFYTELCGWSVEEMDMGEMGKYLMLKRGTEGLGGIVPFTEGPAEIPSHWINYITTSDVDATCKKAESLGGKTCVPPTDIPNVGRFAVVNDPTGAVFTPFRAKTSEPPERAKDAQPEPGEFCWHELMTTDVEKCKAFYGQLFGWTFEKAPMPGMEYWLALRDGRQTAGLMKKPEDVPAPPHWMSYILFASLEQAHARAKDLGAKELLGPTPIPNIGSFSIIQDPAGAAVALFEGG